MTQMTYAGTNRNRCSGNTSRHISLPPRNRLRARSEYGHHKNTRVRASPRDRRAFTVLNVCSITPIVWNTIILRRFRGKLLLLKYATFGYGNREFLFDWRQNVYASDFNLLLGTYVC